MVVDAKTNQHREEYFIPIYVISVVSNADSYEIIGAVFENQISESIGHPNCGAVAIGTITQLLQLFEPTYILYLAVLPSHD